MTLSTDQCDIHALVTAVRKNKSLDSRPLMAQCTWDALAPFLVCREAEVEECLFRQGESSRSVYFLEGGMLRVFRSQQGADRLQLAVLGPGSVVGEGNFFAPIARVASAEMLEDGRVWELSVDAFDLLTRRDPAAALELCKYLGWVVVTRMLSVAGRLSIT